MRNGTYRRGPWYSQNWFARAVQVLGVVEVAVGAVVVYSHHQSWQGFAFMVLGVATFFAGPWLSRRSNRFKIKV